MIWSFGFKAHRLPGLIVCSFFALTKKSLERFRHILEVMREIGHRSKRMLSRASLLNTDTADSGASVRCVWPCSGTEGLIVDCAI